MFLGERVAVDLVGTVRANGVDLEDTITLRDASSAVSQLDTCMTLPIPPQVQSFDLPREGAGYVPMFRAANAGILAVATAHPLHPVSATVEVLEIMQTLQRKLASTAH